MNIMIFPLGLGTFLGSFSILCGAKTSFKTGLKVRTLSNISNLKTLLRDFSLAWEQQHCNW